ncbi:MAG: hypothetical protein MUP85_13730 [Candidatus Lokiarchaeota archaeon]|nr:hypothetical protein [Candidatus Lokiarchaeota archaeon]
MEKQVRGQVTTKKEDVSGSETVFERVKSKTPWIFGNALRKPKIRFPDMTLPRMDMPLPGKSIAVIFIYVILFLLQTGIVYLIYTEPPAMGGDAYGNPLFLYPTIHDAFIVESIVASIFIFLCSLGFIFLYQASKHVYNKKIAVRILAIGILLVLISYTALQAMITIKSGGKLFGNV